MYGKDETESLLCTDLNCLSSHLESLKMMVASDHEIHHGHFIPEFLEEWMFAPIAEDKIAVKARNEQRSRPEVRLKPRTLIEKI